MKTLKPADFPLTAKGGDIYRAGGGAPYLTSLPDDVAIDLVEALNRDAAQMSKGVDEDEAAGHMMVGPSLGGFNPVDS